MPSSERVSKEVSRILRVLRTQFEDCLPLEKGYKNLSFGTGIYGLKSRTELLYVGMASAFRTRFQTGHQTLAKMFLDGLNAVDIRVVTVPITVRYLDHLSDIEDTILFALHPKYNERIPSPEKMAKMKLKETTSGQLTQVLKFLPDRVVEALEDHADTYGLSDLQVLELAIAQFLDLDSVSFGDREQYKGLGAALEQNAILKARLKALGEEVED
ncbi:hypothetical protein [Phormidesmis priestleyi]